MSKKCYCGKPKRRNTEACDRCAWLDGDGDAATVIGCLRSRANSPMSVSAICAETSLDRKTVQEVVAALVSTKRARRIGWITDGVGAVEYQLIAG